MRVKTIKKYLKKSSNRPMSIESIKVNYMSLSSEYTEAPILEHQAYKEHVGGSVFNAAGFGFMPAFMDIQTSETHLSTYLSGDVAAIHILDGLPRYWVAEWGTDGRASALKLGIVAGFIRSGRFYTLNEIINNLRDA
jgi:hypothetical protein